MQRVLKFRALTAFIALLALVGAGCGGDEVVTGTVGEIVGADGAGSLDGVPSADGEHPRGHRYMILTLREPGQPLVLQIDDAEHAFFKVIDLQNGQPASGVPLTLELTQTAPTEGSGVVGDASISSTSVLSDSQGMGTVVVRAGAVPEVQYDLRASTTGAESAVLPIQVTGLPTGDLRVTLAWEGPIPLKTIRVGLRQGNFNCTQYHPENPPSSSAGEKTVLGANSKALFDSLLAGERYSVFAVATTEVEGEGEHLAAGGCLDSVFVAAGSVADVTMQLRLAPLRLAGAYTVRGRFDFTNVAEDFLDSQGAAGEVIADVLRFFRNPGEIIFKYVIEAARLFLPGYVAELIDLVWDFIGDPIEDAVSDWLKDLEALEEFWTIGEDITGVVSDLELISRVKFSKVYSDFTLNGKEDFIGLALYWRLGCDDRTPRTGCSNPPPENDVCGRYPFTLRDFNDPDFPLDLASSNFTARIVNWNGLDIDPHVIKINYGKLILYGLNHILLPAISGETSLSAAFKKMMSCDSLDGFAGFSASDVRNACNGAMGLIGTFIESTMAGLNWNSNLTLHGNATLIDDSDNLVVDRITKGRYTGNVVLNGQLTSSFCASFAGKRETTSQ